MMPDEKRQFFSLIVHWNSSSPMVDSRRHLLPVALLTADGLNTGLRHVQYSSLNENARPEEKDRLDYA
jgi:hypothetical protein